MPAPTLDHTQVRRGFGRAAAGYAQYAVLQREVERRLLEHLDEVPNPPERILDMGCGLGTASLELKKRWPKAQVIALDSALPMLHLARKTAGRWRPRFACVAGDARALPFAPQSIDLLFSNLCMPWVEDVSRLLLQWRKVLHPEGYVLASTLAPATLEELAQAFGHADPDHAHVHGFASIQLLGDTLMAAGFRNPVLLNECFTLTYPNLPQLLQDLRATGSTNALQQRRRSLTGKGRLQRAKQAYEALRGNDGLLPASVEVVYLQALAHKPKPDGG
ncbi:MAG: malonyl-ACP O-methyltransferase BioC [Xanthomonadales bacterium]|nr:malonyl-ACP O-methyltransferase BioC [Xanthomonadales bacterium]